MKVITVKEETIQTLSIGKGDLTDLLNGALIGADKSKSAISRLGSVYISYGGGELAVKATDRYSLVIGRLHIGYDHKLDEIQILVNDVKRILTLMKEDKSHKDSPITLARIGDVLTVHNANSSITIRLMGESFPPVDSIFKTFAPIDSLSLNASYLGAFAKIPSSSKDSQIFLEFTTVTVAGTTVPGAIKIKVPHDTITWECALMPMRVK